jgi:hypothetical protein
MVVCALPPQPAMVEQRPLWGIEDWTLVQGPVAHQLRDRFKEVLKHWSEASESVVLGADAQIDEDVSYDPVPPKRVYTVRVKYRSIGQGHPLAYPFPEQIP